MFPTLALVFALLAGVQAEQPSQQQPQKPPEQRPGYRIGVAVNQIFLPVSARSFGGGFVRGLTKDDFQILEDGAKQDIANFYAEASLPIHVVLLLDISGSTRSVQGEIRRAALEFVKNLSPDDQVAVIVFNYQPRLVLNWTNDLNKIQTSLESVYPRGNTVLHDALYVTFDDLLKTVDGRKAVILLTDGADTGSMVSRDEVVRLALESEAVVYTVSKLDEYWAGAIAARMEYQAASQFIPEELTDEYIIANKRFLQRVSEQTGGKVLDTRAYSSLVDIYKAVADELKNQYYISYIPKNILRDGSWRNLEVRALRPGVVAATKPGYYAPREAAAAQQQQP
ncbi:MAG: VWA domain-containing protein [Acidobacteria bacterium]|nr:MAG: VWA domain-containing protein [Acidobacteriota bacterium]